MEKKRRFPWRRLAAGLLMLSLLAASLLAAERALLPPRTGYGAVWYPYLQEPEDSLDVLFFGSSMVYCDVLPGEVCARTGIRSFVMAGPEQTLSLTLPYIRESLRTQKPSVVMVELTGVIFRRYQGFTRVNVSYMPRFSRNRLEATFRGSEPEERLGLLFPLYNYHDRWQEISLTDLFRPRADETPDPYAGATPITERHPQEPRGVRVDVLPEEEIAENLAALLEIREACREKGVRLVFFQVPSCSPLPEEYMERVRAAIGDTVEIVDFDRDFAALGLDPETDFFDRLHLNVYGAAKFNRALSDYLLTLPELERRSPGDAGELWRQRMDAIGALLEA